MLRPSPVERGLPRYQGTPTPLPTHARKPSGASPALQQIRAGTWKPSASPMRVVVRMRDQAGAHRVPDEIPGLRPQILLATDPVVEEPGLPNGTAHVPLAIHRAGRTRFASPHACGQVRAAQPEQPMHVIRHDDPGVRQAHAFFVAALELDRDLSRDHRIDQNRRTTAGHKSHGICSACLRMPASGQSWTRHGGSMQATRYTRDQAFPGADVGNPARFLHIQQRPACAGRCRVPTGDRQNLSGRSSSPRA